MHWFWRATLGVLAGTFTYAGILVPSTNTFAFARLEQAVGQELAFWVWFVFPTICLALLVYGRLAHLQYTSGRDLETRCRQCGYILRGITEPRCPECGERI